MFTHSLFYRMSKKYRQLTNPNGSDNNMIKIPPIVLEKKDRVSLFDSPKIFLEKAEDFDVKKWHRYIMEPGKSATWHILHDNSDMRDFDSTNKDFPLHWNIDMYYATGMGTIEWKTLPK